jgi:hypothetical protein
MRSRRYHLLPSLHLSYTPQHIKESIQALNQFQVIVFAHPGPHPTKSNTGFKHERYWQRFYTKTKARKISIFHDRHWDRSNEWCKEVADHVDYVHAAQHHFEEAIHRYPGSADRSWGYFPLNLSRPIPKMKLNHIVWGTQWLSIKNHRFLLPHMMDLRCAVHSYGSGQEYHKRMETIKAVYHEDHHYDEVQYYNEASKHVHFGHTEYSKFIQAMAKAWFSLDLSSQGMTNMTHWEPLTVKTLSIMTNQVLDDPHCEIPGDCCLPINLDHASEELNRVCRLSIKKRRSITESAWKFVQRCDQKKVAQQILDQVIT